jgi:hypothetical protein
MPARFNVNKSCMVTRILIGLAIPLLSSCALAYQWPHLPGTNQERPPVASCSVHPTEVLVGDPVTATVTVSNFNPKHTLAYLWTPSIRGGKVIGKDAIVQVGTTNAAPGDYTVSVRVTDTNEKKNNQVICSADFTVKPLPPKRPPAISITANPVSAPAGGTVNLSANCTSPDGVPVTVSSWTSAGGTVSGTGDSATLDTAEASPGLVAVSADCTDSRGLHTRASTEVTVENPPAPIEVVEARLALHSIYFPPAMPSISKPDGGLVTSQRGILVLLAADFKRYLESKPGLHLILEGHADPRGRAQYNQKLSERRVDRVKSFLVDQGISEDNIETKAFGTLHTLDEAGVKDAVENDPQLSAEERKRTLRNLRTIVLASDRRVDITLSTTGQSSVRQFPFNAEDALTLIGGRERKPRTRAKAAPKKAANKQ